MRTESFSTPEPVRLEIRIPAGDVEIETAEGTETVVELEFRGRDADQVEQEARIEARGREIVIESAQRMGQDGDYRVRVVTPHDVDVRESSAARINTASGDVRIRRVAEGDLRIHSASGDVEVGIAKGSRLWVDAQSLSGSTSSELELEGAPADDEGPLVELRAQTMSGDIAV